MFDFDELDGKERGNGTSSSPPRGSGPRASVAFHQDLGDEKPKRKITEVIEDDFNLVSAVVSSSPGAFRMPASLSTEPDDDFYSAQVLPTEPVGTDVERERKDTEVWEDDCNMVAAVVNVRKSASSRSRANSDMAASISTAPFRLNPQQGDSDEAAALAAAAATASSALQSPTSGLPPRSVPSPEQGLQARESPPEFGHLPQAGACVNGSVATPSRGECRGSDTPGISGGDLSPIGPSAGLPCGLLSLAGVAVLAGAVLFFQKRARGAA